MANFSGNVHGGTILKYLDQVAYACASRYAGQYVDPVGRPGRVPRTHPRGRTGYLPGGGELHRPHLDGDRHQGRH
ncbi:hypothetical protein G6F57_023880 [Rhizopus arrhizus]|nr:hypothetical protein G6F57_023880 [Rhizopus arrhizus]